MEIQKHSFKLAAIILALTAVVGIGTQVFAEGQDTPKESTESKETVVEVPPIPDPVEPEIVMDKKISSWAKADVEWMISKNLVPEHLQGNYKSNITRQEYTDLVAPVLHHLTGAEEELHKVLSEHKFEDSFGEELYQAYSFGIINGVSDKEFRPSRNIERQEAVTMMGNILKTLQVGGLVKDKAPYVDYSVIPAWAREAADITFNAKIFQGSDAGMEPDKPYTREQAIVTMKRLADFVKEVKGISYRGKVFIEFANIDDVRVGSNYVKIGSPKAKSNFSKFWTSVSSNFAGVTLNGVSSEEVSSGEYTIETFGEDYLIRISW